MNLTICLHLLFAIIAGGLIGMERTFHGRAAGFRTHVLVCMASSLLMGLVLFESEWASGMRTDPTRMAQGIMTGIGFLGAGVIWRESGSVRGLTTAASIWVTAAIGILFGGGFYIPGWVAVGAVVTVLSLFRFIESWMPAEKFLKVIVEFDRESEGMLRDILSSSNVSIVNLTYRGIRNGCNMKFEYSAGVKYKQNDDIKRVVRDLSDESNVLSFSVTPTNG